MGDLNSLQDLHISVKANMYNKLNKYYISDISRMIINYIEYDCLEQRSKEYVDGTKKLAILGNGIDLCNIVKLFMDSKEYSNRKIVIILCRYGDYGGCKKNIEFLMQLIKEKIKNIKIRLGKICGFANNVDESLAFGNQYYKTISNPLQLKEEKQKLISFNKKYLPKYDHEILETCMNGVYMSCDVKMLGGKGSYKHELAFLNRRKIPLFTEGGSEYQLTKKQLSKHSLPLLFSESMEDQLRLLEENIRHRKGKNEYGYLFKCILLEKNNHC